MSEVEDRDQALITSSLKIYVATDRALYEATSSFLRLRCLVSPIPWYVGEREQLNWQQRAMGNFVNRFDAQGGVPGAKVAGAAHNTLFAIW